MNILVTGAAGWTAQSILEALYADGHTLVGFDLPTAQAPPAIAKLFTDYHTGTIQSYADVSASMRDVDAVVHTAVAIGDGDYDTPDIPFATNVRGTANLFEAARKQAMPPRIIVLSSATVHLNHTEPVDALENFALSPDGDFLYDLTKVLQEDIARRYCETFAMTVIVLRLGHIVDGRTHRDPKGRDLAEVTYNRGGWVCRYDVADAVMKALIYDSGYDAFHVIGAYQAYDLFEIERTELLLGHTSKVDFSDYTTK